MGSFEAFAAWGADDREAGFPVHCLHWKTSKQWETTLVLIDFLLRDEIVYNKKTLTVLCEASIVSRHLQFMTIMNSEPGSVSVSSQGSPASRHAFCVLRPLRSSTSSPS